MTSDGGNITPTSGFSGLAGLPEVPDFDSELLLTSSFEDGQLRPIPWDAQAGFSGDPNLPKRLHVTNIPFRYR